MCGRGGVGGGIGEGGGEVDYLDGAGCSSAG